MGHVPLQRAGSQSAEEEMEDQFDLAAAPGVRGLFLLYLLASLGKSLDERAEANPGLEYRKQALMNELAVN
jgi:hypothetical protein